MGVDLEGVAVDALKFTAEAVSVVDAKEGLRDFRIRLREWCGGGARGEVEGLNGGVAEG